MNCFGTIIITEQKGEKEMNLAEKKLNSKMIYKGKIIDMHVDEVLLPNGSTSFREVVDHNGGVCIAPLTQDGDLLFVRQFRYPYDEVILELPAGKLEKGEDALEAGKRELTEETGAFAEEFIDMGKLYPSPGYCGEIIHMYLAKVKGIGATNFDEDEFLEIERISLKKATEMMLSGEIKDAKTQVLIGKLALMQK